MGDPGDSSIVVWLAWQPTAWLAWLVSLSRCSFNVPALPLPLRDWLLINTNTRIAIHPTVPCSTNHSPNCHQVTGRSKKKTRARPIERTVVSQLAWATLLLHCILVGGSAVSTPAPPYCVVEYKVAWWQRKSQFGPVHLHSGRSRSRSRSRRRIRTRPL